MNIKRILKFLLINIPVLYSSNKAEYYNHLTSNDHVSFSIKYPCRTCFKASFEDEHLKQLDFRKISSSSSCLESFYFFFSLVFLDSEIFGDTPFNKEIVKILYKLGVKLERSNLINIHLIVNKKLRNIEISKRTSLDEILSSENDLEDDIEVQEVNGFLKFVPNLYSKGNEGSKDFKTKGSASNRKSFSFSEDFNEVFLRCREELTNSLNNPQKIIFEDHKPSEEAIQSLIDYLLFIVKEALSFKINN